MSDVVKAAPAHPAWDAVAASKTPAERVLRARGAIGLIEAPGFKRPIPALMLDLPQLDEDQAIIDGILVGLAAADDIVAATKPQDLRKPEDVANQLVTVSDIGVRASDVEDAAWGAYVSLMVQVGDAMPEVINTGSAQVIITLWRCWCEGLFPVRGRFVLLGTAKAGRNQPVGFDVLGEH